MQKTLNKLIDLTKKKNFVRIKTILEEFDRYKKGMLFELFLTELYNGNGYLAKRVGKKNDLGADILLFFKHNPKQVIRIVQAKNHRTPIDKNKTRLELLKFEKDASIEHQCKYFSIVSVSGFTTEARQYEGFNNSLETWDYVKELIEHYMETEKEPIVHLFPHNKIAYNNIQHIWKKRNRACAIQATGTGKSYLILKALSDFSNKTKLVLAPSTYILDQLRKNGGWANEESTVFMSYQKLIKLTNEELKKLNPSLIVLDEFHRLGAKKWGESVRKLLRYYSKAKVLGTSATPIRYLDGSRNMAKELFQGNEASNLSLSDAIVQKILPMPRYICALYTIDEEMNKIEEQINSFAEKNQLKKKWKKKIQQFKADWENANGISTILKKHIQSEKKFIVFCRDKEHLEQMEWLVESWFKKAKIAKRVDRYRMMSNERCNQEQLDSFIRNNDPSSVKLLFSIDMLNEGLHIDSVDGVILLRPTESPIIFYQQIGRAIQANKKEQPLIFDLVNNFSSIRANDFTNDIQESTKKYQRKRKKLDLTTYDVTFTISDETKEILEFDKEIKRRIEDPWEWKFEELLDYIEEFKHARLLSMNKNTHRDLYQWCLLQKKKYDRGTLPDDKVEKLRMVGFHFNQKEEEWEHYYSLLKKFKERHHHTRIQDMYSDLLLKLWCKEQRELYQSNELAPEKQKLLEKIGFSLTDEEEVWNRLYKELAYFSSIHQHTSSEEHIEWIRSIRHKRKNNLLPENKIEELNRIGFIWELEKCSWEEVFHLLNTENHLFAEKEEWLEIQKRKKEEGLLTQQQEKMLVNAGFLTYDKQSFTYKLISLVGKMFKFMQTVK